MGENSKIEWCHHTFNVRLGQVRWGKGAPRKRTGQTNWKLPLKWNQQAVDQGQRPRVFCASLGDWLDDEVPVEWLADLLEVIWRTPCVDWLLLTKRPQNWKWRLKGMLDSYQEKQVTVREWDLMQWVAGWLNGTAPHNIWVGTSVEDQERADGRIPALLRIPARIRFLSMEPLLGPVEFSDATNRADWKQMLGKSALSGIHWVIVGGESGPNARPMDEAWVRSLRDQCRAVGVPFFFKQWGGVNKQEAGRLLEQSEWNQVPEAEQ